MLVGMHNRKQMILRSHDHPNTFGTGFVLVCDACDRSLGTHGKSYVALVLTLRRMPGVQRVTAPLG
jgi:hypothetical protein